MKIGLTYSSREQYGYSMGDLRFTDFLTPADIGFVQHCLEAYGHEVVPIGNAENLLEFHCAGQRVDLVFNMAWGDRGRNREGNVPALLEVLGLPYTGTDAFGCSLCLSKVHTKFVAQHLGIPTPAYFVLHPGGHAHLSANVPLPFPLVLKPSEEGSSMGVTLVQDMDSFRATATELLHLYQGPILCERYIKGRELAVPLLERADGMHALGVVETVALDNSPLALFDAHTKTAKLYKKQLAALPPALEQQLRQASLAVFDFIRGSGFGRADFRLGEDGVPYFLEMAPLPNLGAKSSFCACVEKTGGSFPAALAEIVDRACEKYSITKTA